MQFKNQSKVVHFLQIWCKPNKSRLPPSYTTKAFSDDLKKDKLALVVQDVSAKAAQEVVPINADMSMYASILSPGKNTQHEIQRDSVINSILISREQCN